MMSDKFFPGVVDAAWLVIITMGTVGYGDITATTLRGRIAVLLWVFISLVMTAVLVASISTNLLSAEETMTNFKIYGTKVATLKDSYEYKLAVQRNAIVENIYNSFEEISTALLMGQVDGILVDSYSARDENEYFNVSSFYTKELIQYNDAFGLVINNEMTNSLSALNDYRETNHLIIARRIRENAQKMEIRLIEKKPIPLFDEKSQAMIISLSSITALVAGTSFIGLLFSKILPKFLNRESESKYKMVKRSHLDLMHLIKDFKEILERDSEILMKRQLYDRVRYLKTGHAEWRHFNKEKTRILFLTNEYYTTYDNRNISLDDINALYV